MKSAPPTHTLTFFTSLPLFFCSVCCLGNWSTCLAAGASWGYAHLFVVLFSTLMAMLLQGFATRLGLASGRDLSQACRDAYPRPLAMWLWISAELAMVATDLAEVIGFAVALALLTGLPTGVGVGVAVLDTLILLALPAHAGRVRTLELICALLVAVIFACFATELGLAKPPADQVLSGFLPNSRALGGDGALLVAIGILGATVMPHNLYLHSALVRTRIVGGDDDITSEITTADDNDTKGGVTATALTAAPVAVVAVAEKLDTDTAPENKTTTSAMVSAMRLQSLAQQASPGAPSSDQDTDAQRSRANSSSDFLTDISVAVSGKEGMVVTASVPGVGAGAFSGASDTGLTAVEEAAPMVSLTPRENLAIQESITLGLVDTAVSLSLAFVVNSAILIVAGAAFSGPVSEGLMSAEEAGSLSGAYRLLAPALGVAAPTIFGVALLASGQSSTLTGTMAGQVVMEGFLDIKMAPWLRRLLTRALAIIPAAATVALAGDKGLDRLLVLSQVVLSFQLPFAVVPLVSFASSKKMLGNHAAGPIATSLGWIAALFIIGINIALVVNIISEKP